MNNSKFKIGDKVRFNPNMNHSEYIDSDFVNANLNTNFIIKDIEHMKHSSLIRYDFLDDRGVSFFVYESYLLKGKV